MTRLLAVVACSTHQVTAVEKPNILLLTSEDHGPHMGCYGDAIACTPNIDALAAKGMIFRKAWSVAPVCAPARTAIITGVYSPSEAHFEQYAPMSRERFPEISSIS